MPSATLPSLPPFAHPGLTLGPSSAYLPGPGTHLDAHTNSIIASLAGIPISTPSSRTQPSSSSLPTVSIARRGLTRPAAAPVSRAVVANNTLPVVGSTVLARVTRIEKARVSVVILVVDEPGAAAVSRDTRSSSTAIGAAAADTDAKTASRPGLVNADAMSGFIRREDVRGWEVDKVETGSMFRVGDIVRASVISVGDQAGYYLSTARNELGVLMARSEEGNVMFPVSWREFWDGRAGKAEERKVAKPI